jgi:hypothetical protein
MGWTSPFVSAASVGTALLVVFVWVRRCQGADVRASPSDPRHTFGVIRALPHRPRRADIMLIIWLQGVWLAARPAVSTPLWAGIALLRSRSGSRRRASRGSSDRYGQRLFATGGMLSRSFISSSDCR